MQVGRFGGAGAERQAQRHEPADGCAVVADASSSSLASATQWCLEPGVGGGADGSATRVDRPREYPARWLDGTWEDGMTRLIDGIPHNNRRNAALGNGVVPQCAELIGLRIRQLEEAS